MDWNDPEESLEFVDLVKENLDHTRYMIVLIGPVAVGKTTLALELAKAGYAVASIDDYREQENAYLPYQEAKAWAELEEFLYETKQTVFESSGTGRYFEGILSRYQGEVLLVRLTCSLDELFHRIRKRFRIGYKWPPVSWSTDIFTVTERQYHALQDREADLVIDTQQLTPDQAVQLILAKVS